MLLVELQQLNEDRLEKLSKAIVALAMAASVGAVALGFSSNSPGPEIEAEASQLLHKATAQQVNKIKSLVVGVKSPDQAKALKTELDTLRK